MTKKEETALAMKTEKLGRELMAEAQERQQQTFRGQVREEFDYVLTRIHQHHTEIEKHEEKLSFFLKKKKALENGEFTITTRGQLQMDNPELQPDMVKPLGSY